MREWYPLACMQARCYAGAHAALYLPLGIVAVFLFAVSPPLAFFIMLWRKRESLEEPHTKRVYGFLYDRYRCGPFANECVHTKGVPIYLEFALVKPSRRMHAD